MAEAGTKVTARKAKKLEEDGLKEQLISAEEMYGSYLAEDIMDPETGEVLFEAGDELDKKSFAKLEELNIKKLNLLAIDNINIGPYLPSTMAADKCKNLSLIHI